MSSYTGSVMAKWRTHTKKEVKSNLVIRNGLIRNKLVLRNHFLWPVANLLNKNKEHITLENNFRMTKTVPYQQVWLYIQKNYAARKKYHTTTNMIGIMSTQDLINFTTVCYIFIAAWSQIEDKSFQDIFLINTKIFTESKTQLE